MKIGIPRALLYFEYGKFWEVFLEELGFEVVISPPTNKSIVANGVKFAHSDTCYPVKVAYGHTWWLHDRVDAILIPRYISMDKLRYMCPKFIGLPDTIKASMGDKLPILLEPTFNAKEKPIISGFYELGKKLNKPYFKVKHAIHLAELAYKEFISYRRKHKLKKAARLRIGFVARPYIAYDDYLNLRLFKILEEYGVDVVLYESINPNTIKQKVHEVQKRIYYSMGERNVGAAFYFLDHEELFDGVIYVISFQCGPDSVLGELILSKARKSKVALLPIVIDEHASESGLRTRVEAFLDMLTRKKHRRV